MCEGCEEIINEKKPVIRQAAFKYKNDFVGANELISIIEQSKSSSCTYANDPKKI